MSDELLRQLGREIPGMRAVLITAMPDCLLYASWIHDRYEFAADEVASYFGDLMRANRSGLKALGSWSAEMQVTIESADAVVMLREIRSDFVCGCLFDSNVALGMVRLHLKQLIATLEQELPQVQVTDQSRAARVLAFLERYAPDLHAVMLRVSLRTGLPKERLEMPNTLAEDETRRIEQAACDILGLPELKD